MRKILNASVIYKFQCKSIFLVQVTHGHQWFIHCIYTVRSEENAARGIGKRDTLVHIGHQHHALGKLPNNLPGQETTSSNVEYQHLSNKEERPLLLTRPESLKFLQSTKGRKKRANEVPPLGDDSGTGTNMHRLSLKLQYRENLGSSLPDQVG